MSRVAACVLLSALVLCASACNQSPERASNISRPNILLVTIDTFRADRLTAAVAPAMNRLANAGLSFTAARSAVPLTLPSHATILTGLLPPAHGVRENGVDVLGDTHQAIGSILKEASYHTAAFVGAFVLDRRFGLARGFDTYDDRIPRDPNATERLEAERPASAVVDAALTWLNQTPTPFFVWIHLYDPHAPYTPPREFLKSAETDTLRYEAEISYADSQIARVFGWLRDRGLMDRTMVVIAGDHGEGLGDHGERTHGMLVYDSTLRVPLVVVAPGHAPERRDEPASLADVAPTILRTAGLTPPAAMKGRDLLVRPRTDIDLYAETEYPRVAGWSPLAALTDDRWKAIRAGGTTEIYDLRRDPDEKQNVADRQAAVAAAMTARIDAIRGSGTPATRHAVSADAQERLRALGYVASSVPASESTGGPTPMTSIGAWTAFEDALAALNANRADAVRLLANLATAHPGAPVFQTTYARALKDAGRTKEALAVYRAAAKRWPTDAVLLHDLAVAARDAGNADEARRADEAAVALTPSTAMAHNGLGLIAIDQGRLDEAARAFERAAALDPNNASYWTNLGNARRALRDAAAAERAYRQALAVDDRAGDAANGLGVLSVEAQRPAEAVPWFERALAATPDLVEARLNLGIALQQSGNVKRAAESYRQVLGARGSHAREKDAARRLLSALQ